jgi:hypothetical protein
VCECVQLTELERNRHRILCIASTHSISSKETAAYGGRAVQEVLVCDLRLPSASAPVVVKSSNRKINKNEKNAEQHSDAAMGWFVLERTTLGSGLYFSNTRLTYMLAAIIGDLPSLNKTREKYKKICR